MATQLRRALRVSLLALLMLATLALPPTAWSAEPQVGVVTMLLGTATVARAALSQPASLTFKDGVFLRDRITTAEKSAVRVLLGGKATVTARERSVLTITEVPRTSTVLLTAGQTAVAVSKAQMKPGETVEIKTPHVVAAIRGTFVVAEVSAGRSTITILRGLVEVTKLDPATGRPVGAAVKVGALQRVIVTDAGPVPAPQTITLEASKSLASDFTFLPTNPPVASGPAFNQAVQEALMTDAPKHTVNSITSPAIGPLTRGTGMTGIPADSITARAIGALIGGAGVTGTPADSIAAPAIGAVTGGTGLTGTAGNTIAPVTGALTGGTGLTGTAGNTIAPVTGALTGGTSLTGTAGSTIAPVTGALTGGTSLTGTAGNTIAPATGALTGGTGLTGTGRQRRP